MISDKADKTILVMLKACVKSKDLYEGSKIHAHILKVGLLKASPYVIGRALISMYSKCGSLSKAQQVLEELPLRDIICWNSLLIGFVQKGQDHDALNCFECMQNEGLHPDSVTFTCVLKCCAKVGCLDKGKEIHDRIINVGLLEKDAILGTALVDMYAKCGMLAKASEVLEKLPNQDVISWNALIGGYAQHGQCDAALECFECMQQKGLSPDVVTFLSILKSCGNAGVIEKAEQIHDVILHSGFLKKDIELGNALVDMYAKCGMYAKARKAHKELPVRNVVSWNALISGYTQQGQCHEALNCFEEMQGEGFTPHSVTYTCILNACGKVRAIEKGKQIHNEIVSRGLVDKDTVLGNALVDMYAKCGLLCEAQHVLQGLSSRDTISWSALITGYAQEGHGHEALNCFEGMQNEGLSPNAITFICLLKACGSIGAIDKGKQIHAEIKMKGLLLKKDVALGTALVDMYAKCGALAQAQQVLEELPIRNTLSWSALIAGYAQQGQGYEALKCFHRMQSDGISPDNITFLCVLSACGRAGLLHEAKTLLGEMTIRYGIAASLEHHICMVMVFGCAGHFDDAMSVINTMPSSDHLEAWIVLLGACRKWGNWKLGRLAFDQIMQLDSSCAAAYVLIDNIFLAAGMKEDAKKVEDMKLKYSALTKGKNGVTVEASGTELHLDFLIKRLSLSNT